MILGIICFNITKNLIQFSYVILADSKKLIIRRKFLVYYC